MSWDDIKGTREQVEQLKQQADAEQQALARGCQQACKDVAFRHMLLGLALSRSFTHGRAAESVAYAEGQRELAIRILNMAKVTGNE